jgi:hypothetical protein
MRLIQGDWPISIVADHNGAINLWQHSTASSLAGTPFSKISFPTTTSWELTGALGNDILYTREFTIDSLPAAPGSDNNWAKQHRHGCRVSTSIKHDDHTV